MQRFEESYFSRPRSERQRLNNEIRIPLRTNGQTRRQNGGYPLAQEDDYGVAAGRLKREPAASEVDMATVHEQKQAESQAETTDWKEKYTRLVAERENDRKRLERNYANRFDQERDRILQEMLPLADNLERALAHATEQEASLREGVDLTLKAFTDTLAKHGVTPIVAEGRRFDPNWHEAIGAVPHPTLDSGSIVSVVKTGYSVKGRLLRPARVLVAA